MIYLVVESGGEFSDKWSTNRFAFTEKADAEKCVAFQIEAAIKTRNGLVKLFEFFKQYSLDYPKPVATSRHIETMPKWPSGLGKGEITKEMRAERVRVKQLNDEILEDYQERMLRYWNAFFIAQREYADREGIAPPENCPVTYYSTDDDENSWDIEEHELLTSFKQ